MDSLLGVFITKTMTYYEKSSNTLHGIAMPLTH